MNTFIIGLLTGIVFFVVVFIAIYIGYRIGKQKQPSQLETDEDSKREAKELQEAFVKLMNYDVNTALQPRKKV